MVQYYTDQKKVSKIILACCILHSIAMEHGLPEPEDILGPEHGMVPPRSSI